MLIDSVAKSAPAPALPLIAHSQSSRGDDSATAFPWLESVGHRSANSYRAGEVDQDVVSGWLKVLGLSFGSCVRMIDLNRELTWSGGGPVCHTLDAFCGRRAVCRQAHRALHTAAFESGCTQQICCPFGFTLVSVPVRVKESWWGQIEFGPFGVERIDRVEFERCLDRYKFTTISQRSQLLVSLNAVRILRADDVGGVHALVERVAGVVAEEILRRSTGLGVGEPAVVMAGRRYAELHLGDKIKLADVASHVALSIDHFSRLFRNTTGVSFGEYVNRRRVNNAQQLLADSNQRVADISYACGFDSVPHFNRVFRRVTGVSPTRYRRKLRCDDGCLGLIKPYGVVTRGI